MPMYDYQCTECGHEENRIVSIKDRNKQKCNEKTPVPGHTLPPRKWQACKGKMVRKDEVAETANMKTQWAGWQ